MGDMFLIPGMQQVDADACIVNCDQMLRDSEIVIGQPVGNYYYHSILQQYC